MDWGVLQGLGQGLQSIGKWKMEQDAEKRRTMMAEQLQRDREERAKLAYDSSQDSMEKSPEGVWFTVKKNKGGEVMDRVLAPKNKIEEAEDAEKTRGLKARLLEAQVSNTEYSGKRAITEDTREDEDRNLLSREDRRQIARYKGGLDITPAQQLQANTSLQTAVTRGAGRGSAKSKDEDVDYQDIASDLKKQDPATYLDVGKLMGTTSDSATTAVIASLIQELTSQFPDRKLSPQDIMAAARAYRARWKSDKAGNDSTTSVSTRLQP